MVLIRKYIPVKLWICETSYGINPPRTLLAYILWSHMIYKWTRK